MGTIHVHTTTNIIKQLGKHQFIDILGEAKTWSRLRTMRKLDSTVDTG
jgi:hypothetical protein